MAVGIDDLPCHLSERVVPLTPGEARPDAAYVLYWMHHAVRGHDNPALDVAVEVGNRLGLPVLVYQGLAGRHRYNSDRHHVFIIDGARDAARELEDRGIRHAFHLPRDPAAPSPLPVLAAQAALVVAEDFPAPPFPSWTRRLAARVDRPMWLVDARCIVPMRTVTPRCDRAFRFRKQTWDRCMAALRAPWNDVTPSVAPHEGALPFDPVDLESCDPAALAASCGIDHAVGPVHHTPGGAQAGYARWDAFKRSGLAGYARRRNDALQRDGVSRLSPYLHHGHVSPWRIARETLELGGGGADKFLDELLVWRELSHHVCVHHTSRLEQLDVLPDWARATLETHAADPRPADYSWETLARARTHDRLWNAAQRSLLVHGELHNNVRMTWGKAVPQWTRNPEEALEVLVDLNHRYALDGNDPNSYGGLLWCLGMLDRPFEPQRPVLGLVRPRSTEQHAERLDVGAYERIVAGPAGGPSLTVAVVGAGLAGLAAARTLQDHGHDVVVVDKGRGPGGRTARRRDGEHRFDHGAQYFTARDPSFTRLVASWRRDGVVEPWSGHLVAIEEGGRLIDKNDDEPRYVGVPGMNAIARHLALDLDVQCGIRVTGLERRGDRIGLRADGGEAMGPFDAAIVTTPPPQAATLIASVDESLAAEIAAVPMDPCWAVMAAFDRALPLEFDGAFVNIGPLSWIARDSSKPGRPSGERWVLHAGPRWSHEHLEDDPDDVTASLLDAFGLATGLEAVAPTYVRAHRWRYATPIRPLAEPCRFDTTGTVAVAGDWCGGPRVEGAFLSGIAAAARLLGRRRVDDGRGTEPLLFQSTGGT